MERKTTLLSYRLGNSGLFNLNQSENEIGKIIFGDFKLEMEISKKGGIRFQNGIFYVSLDMLHGNDPVRKFYLPAFRLENIKKIQNGSFEIKTFSMKFSYADLINEIHQTAVDYERSKPPKPDCYFQETSIFDMVETFPVYKVFKRDNRYFLKKNHTETKIDSESYRVLTTGDHRTNSERAQSGEPELGMLEYSFAVPHYYYKLPGSFPPSYDSFGFDWYSFLVEQIAKIQHYAFTIWIHCCDNENAEFKRIGDTIYFRFSLVRKHMINGKDDMEISIWVPCMRIAPMMHDGKVKIIKILELAASDCSLSNLKNRIEKYLNILALEISNRIEAYENGCRIPKDFTLEYPAELLPWNNDCLKFYNNGSMTNEFQIGYDKFGRVNESLSSLLTNIPTE